MTNVKKIIIYIAICITLICSSYIAGSSITKHRLMEQSNKLGRVCDQLRERILDAEDTNRRLAETVEQCRTISGDLGQSVERNIRTARDAIEVIEELRVQVYNLEVVCGDFDWDEYYSTNDSLLYDEIGWK